MKAPVCGGNYAIDQTVDMIQQVRSDLPRMIQNVKIQSANICRYEFLRENPEWKKPQGEERKNSLSFSMCYKRVFLNTFFSSFLVFFLSHGPWPISKLFVM